MSKWSYWAYDDDGAMVQRHELQARRKRGTIRYALAGLALGGLAMASIKPVCYVIVWAGTIMEGFFNG